MYYKQKTGKDGENIATEYLKNKGYNVIERNFECRQGEIDIIALDKDEIVFVEVKTRTSKKYGLAAEAVDDVKKKHLWKAVEYYVYSRNLQNEFIRIDVVEVYLNKNKANINHIKGAIQ
jgi:putative endonuclease